MATDPKHLKVFMYHPTEGSRAFDPDEIRDLDDEWRDTPYYRDGVLIEDEVEPEEKPANGAPPADDTQRGPEPVRLDFSSTKAFNAAHKKWETE